MRGLDVAGLAETALIVFGAAERYCRYMAAAVTAAGTSGYDNDLCEFII